MFKYSVIAVLLLSTTACKSESATVHVAQVSSTFDPFMGMTEEQMEQIPVGINDNTPILIEQTFTEKWGIPSDGPIPVGIREAPLQYGFPEGNTKEISIILEDSVLEKVFVYQTYVQCDTSPLAKVLTLSELDIYGGGYEFSMFYNQSDSNIVEKENYFASVLCSLSEFNTENEY